MISTSLRTAILSLLFVNLMSLDSNVVSQETRELAATKGLVSAKPSEGRYVETDRGYMVPYSETIPGTNVQFEMVPIAGGEFLLGSPTDEADRREDEGPQVSVKVAPFWLGKCEVTWAEYRAYMDTYSVFKALNKYRIERRRFGEDVESLQELPEVKQFLATEQLDVDAVTSPTPLYDASFTYGSGEEPNQPAVTMTQFGAKQYTKWLSGMLERQYRLPTEAEWEYAARAGSVGAYSIPEGDQLEDYCWYAENSEDQLQAVGTKQPNAWGLHDMHGNVAELVLDEYAADHYSKLTNGVEVQAAVNWPTQLYPRVIRGGGWFDTAADCRSAARYQTNDPEWTASDPNLPVSPWWFTEEVSMAVGFRILRPLAVMDESLCKRVWDADIEALELDVKDRLLEGRGTRSATNPQLPAAVEELKSAGLAE